MAQNNNSSIIGFAVSAVLALGALIFLYISHGDVQDLTAQLAASKNSEQALNGTVNEQIDQLNQLRNVVAPSSNQTQPEPSDPENDLTLNAAKSVLLEISGDGTAADGNLVNALRSTKSESNQHQLAATVRQGQLDVAAADLQNTITQKDALIEEIKQARDRAEKALRDQESAHAEKMKSLEDQIRKVTAEKNQADIERGRLQTTLDQERLAWSDKREEMMGWLVDLRAQLRAKEDLKFSKPDGLVTAVDHNEKLVFIDLGFADGLRKGVGFSVYAKNHSGIGGNSTSDIKGKLEVTELLGIHRAKARIVESEASNPIAPDDPIYSPIFQPGQTMEVALVGQVNVDGLTREELRRLIRAAGSKISVEVGRTGEFTDSDGNEISQEQALANVTSRTRFLVIGDVGDPNSSSADAGQEAIFDQMRTNKAELEEKCAGLGIYPVGLSAFLEHIGFSPKQRAWTAESGKSFPSTLANGARSAATNTRFGNRESGAAISGLYTNRNRAATESTGQVSKLFSGK